MRLAPQPVAQGAPHLPFGECFSTALAPCMDGEPISVFAYFYSLTHADRILHLRINVCPSTRCCEYGPEPVRDGRERVCE